MDFFHSPEKYEARPGAAAKAIRERAALVTGDREFKKLGRVVAIDWLS